MSVGVAVLGSTGSIGRSTLQVLSRQRDRFRVVALTGHSNKELLAQQAAEWNPEFVGLVNGGDRGTGNGTSCLVEAATHPDVRIVVNGIVGAAGLEATLAALHAGKRVALANKETLVMAGELVAEAAREGGGEIVPVDSEHSAVLQCVAGRRPTELARLILTASGGPFRTLGAERVGREAARLGGTAPARFNAANEVAVQLFLEEKITFGRIAEIIEHVVGRGTGETGDGGRGESLEEVLAADTDARRMAQEAACS